jgi:hypothetical protein
MNRSKRLLTIKPDMPIDTLQAWENRHNQAVTCPTPGEAVIIAMIQAVALYIRQQEEGTDDLPWYDYVLSVGVGEMIGGIRTLLNGDLGRLDGGTLDAVLWSLAERASFDLDLMRMAK